MYTDWIDEDMELRFWISEIKRDLSLGNYQDRVSLQRKLLALEAVRIKLKNKHRRVTYKER